MIDNSLSAADNYLFALTKPLLRSTPVSTIESTFLVIISNYPIIEYNNFFFERRIADERFPSLRCTSIFQNIVHFETPIPTRTRARVPQSQPGIPLTCIFFRTASPVRFPRERHDVESDQPAFLEPADTAAIDRGEAYSSAP